MSNEAIDWAWSVLDQCGTPGQQITLLALAWQSDERGVSGMSLRGLEAATRIGGRAQGRCLSGLVSAGLVYRHRRVSHDGGDAPALTFLRMPEDYGVA